jgi:hypothetical protein
LLSWERAWYIEETRTKIGGRVSIKNKDGSSYRLRGPNKLLDGQERWDEGEVRRHNFRWKGVSIPDDTPRGSYRPQTVVIPEEVRIPDREEIPEPEPGLAVPETVPVVPDREVRPVIPAGVQKTTFHCLPAVIREHEDPVYGERTRTIEYGDPFTFEGVVVSNGHVDFEFWAAAPGIDDGAVVFPINKDRRWWRVSTSEEKTGGRLYRCLVSDFTPDFSSPARR